MDITRWAADPRPSPRATSRVTAAGHPYGVPRATTTVGYSKDHRPQLGHPQDTPRATDPSGPPPVGHTQGHHCWPPQGTTGATNPGAALEWPPLVGHPMGHHTGAPRVPTGPLTLGVTQGHPRGDNPMATATMVLLKGHHYRGHPSHGSPHGPPHVPPPLVAPRGALQATSPGHLRDTPRTTPCGPLLWPPPGPSHGPPLRATPRATAEGHCHGPPPSATTQGHHGVPGAPPPPPRCF